MINITTGSPQESSRLIKTYTAILLAVWSSIIFGMGYYAVHSAHDYTVDEAKATLVSSIDRDMAYRFWVVKHGGVYVWVDEDTQPNPHLANVPDRDINVSGRVLTLMNSAYALRQMMDWQGEKFGVKTHISSLDPLRPQNIADEWEAKTLKRFSSGERDDIFEEISDGTPKMRAMRVLLLEKSCLKCHEHKDSKEGQIRGGISATVDMTKFLAHEKAVASRVVVSYCIIWLLGVLGGIFAYRHILARIGELSRMQANVKQSVERFKSLSENGKMPVLAIDSSYTVSYANGAVSQLLKKSADEIVGSDVRQLCVGGDNWERRLADAFAKSSLQEGMVGCYGREFEYRIVPQFDENGAMVAAMILLFDLTQILQAKKQLEDMNAHLEQTIAQESAKRYAREQLLASIFASSALAIAVCDKEFNIREFNTAFVALTGYDKERLTQMKFAQITHPLDTQKEQYLLSGFGNNESNRIVRYQKRIMREDSSIVMVDVSISVGINPKTGGMMMLAVLEDVTRKYELEEKQKNQQQMLIQQSKMAAMGEMIGAIAHQWRQPLNALALLIQDIPEALQFGEMNETYAKEMVTRGMRQIGHMNKTIDDFRNFFRPDKEIKDFDLYEAVRSVASLLSAQLKSSGIEIYFNCPDKKSSHSIAKCEECSACSVQISGYENELKQAVLNILANAKDAILEQKTSKRFDDSRQWRIDVSIEYEQDRVTLRIKDNGGGIKPEVLARMFEPYFTTKGGAGGTGIGLYMTKTIIEENMHGKISAQNIDDGAQFTIELPR